MNRRTRILLGISAVVLLAAAAAILGALLTRDTVLELRVRDAVSHRWVWDLTLRLQDRELRSFYQSDTALRTFRFTHLRPGPATLQLSAPDYQALSVPVMPPERKQQGGGTGRPGRTGDPRGSGVS